MLNRDLFEILVPVLLEADLLSPLRIKFRHNVIKAGLEALLELAIVVVASADDCLVVLRVLNLDLNCQLVLNEVLWGCAFLGQIWLAIGSSLGSFHAPVSLELPLEIDLKDGLTEAWELARGSL